MEEGDGATGKGPGPRARYLGWKIYIYISKISIYLYLCIYIYGIYLFTGTGVRHLTARNIYTQGSRAILGSQNPDFFLTIFKLFPDLKINKFLARNLGLRETRPLHGYILFLNQASGAFFPNKDCISLIGKQQFFFRILK